MEIFVRLKLGLEKNFCYNKNNCGGYGTMTYNIELIFLIIIGFLLFLVIILILRRPSKSENLLLMEELERSCAEALLNLRAEQNSLANAASRENQISTDRLSEQIDKRVERLADLTDKNLERIRVTVDERLNASLEQKFTQVSQNLASVHKGLGQVASLASGIDQLRRILSNVKTRGIWGELQLETLLKDMLPPNRFARNVEIRPRSGLRVEFALRFPGKDEQEVLLPIDAKFPQEDYQRLQNAIETGNKLEAENARKQLEQRLRTEAKDINMKYICPPYSTDFAVMYLPSEGLFIEALNMIALVEELQRRYRVCIAGPTTLASLVNSFLLGFRTLEVQKKTQEAWQLLSEIKMELSGLSAVLEKSVKKTEEAQNALNSAGRYVKKLYRKLEILEGEESHDR